MELQEYIQQFQEHLQKSGASANTVLSYSSAVRQFFSFYPSVSFDSLKAYREWLLTQYRPSTVNAKISALNRYILFLEQGKECSNLQGPPSAPGSDTRSEEPCRLPAVRRQQRFYLDTIISEADYEHLKSCLLADQDFKWYFLVHFLGSTGVRVGELIKIKIEHLRMEYMDICSKGGKIRRVYFPHSLCRKALEWYSKEGIHSGFLFTNQNGSPLSPRWINSHLKALALRYQISPDTVYPHSFRHRFAKNFLKRFNDIALLADLLGHESIETTRIYLTKSTQEQRQIIDQIVTW